MGVDLITATHLLQSESNDKILYRKVYVKVLFIMIIWLEYWIWFHPRIGILQQKGSDTLTPSHFFPDNLVPIFSFW